MTTSKFTARYAGMGLLLLAGVPFFSGCSVLKPGADTDPGNGQFLTSTDGDSISSVTVADAETEILETMVLPRDEVAAALPTGPDGYATLADLEELASTALSLAGEGHYDEAEDHLFVLHDQVALPLPADADSTYNAHRGSLERRMVLLGGILAEQNAFGHDPAAADSL